MTPKVILERIDFPLAFHEDIPQVKSSPIEFADENLEEEIDITIGANHIYDVQEEDLVHVRI